MGGLLQYGEPLPCWERANGNATTTADGIAGETPAVPARHGRPPLPHLDRLQDRVGLPGGDDADDDLPPAVRDGVLHAHIRRHPCLPGGGRWVPVLADLGTR